MLRKYGDDLAAAHPLPDLRLITVQGEPLDGDTFTWASTHLGGGVPVVNAYGQTETGSTWTYPVAGVEALKPGSTGTAVPGHVYDILDDDGQPVPPGTKGNLVLTQPFPTLARTVWDDPERYQRDVLLPVPRPLLHQRRGRARRRRAPVGARPRRRRDQRGRAPHLHPGDRGDRRPRIPQVAEAAVVGVPDATKGTVPVAFLTLLDGADPGDGPRRRSNHDVTVAAGRLRPAGRGLPHRRAAQDPHRQDHAPPAAGRRRARRARRATPAPWRTRPACEAVQQAVAAETSPGA